MPEKAAYSDQTLFSTPNSSFVISEFESRVSSFLYNYIKDTPLLAAVSGGADSMSLLAALCTLKDSGLINKNALFCAHVEHGLRPANESCGDADFVSGFCASCGIECRIEHIPAGKINQFAKRKGIGIEAAARFFRHRFLLREAKRLDNNGKKTCIFLAHTKDDLLETALMRILRGAGPAGLRVMPEKRGRIHRPLLSITRGDVIEYLNAKKITWREDSTNNDEKFLRNRIRRQLVPFLSESFPEWKKGAAALAETQSLTADFITKEAFSRIKWDIKNDRKKRSYQSPQFISAEEENFFLQPQIIREEAVFSVINMISSSESSRNVSFKSIKRSVVRQFCSGAVKAADLGPVRIKREKGQIMLSCTQKEFFESGVSHLVKESPLTP